MFPCFYDILPTMQEKWTESFPVLCACETSIGLWRTYLLLLLIPLFLLVLFLFLVLVWVCFVFFFSYERAYSALYQAGPDKGVVVTELPDTSHRCLVRGKGPKANPAALSQLLCLSLRSELHFVSFLWHPTNAGRTRDEDSEHLMRTLPFLEIMWLVGSLFPGSLMCFHFRLPELNNNKGLLDS